MLRIGVLGSGSGGNCAVVASGESVILIDAGLSARQMVARLELLGLDPDRLEAILITHEHGDHVRGLDVFCRKRPVPVYCNPLTREVLRPALRQDIDWRLVETGSRFAIRDLEIQTFPVAHDATDPMGFVVRGAGGAVGVLSDVGYVTNLMRTHLQGLEALFVEANYEEALLQEDLKRPWPTKQRILSRHGHLSNDQVGALVGEVATERLQRVILGHLSQDCNDPELAVGKLRERLRERGLGHVAVCCARQDEPTELFEVRPSRPLAGPEDGPAGRVREGGWPCAVQPGGGERQIELFGS